MGRGSCARTPVGAPARGEIRQRQGVEEPLIKVVSAMSHQIHFHEAGAPLIPRGKGPGSTSE